MREKNLLTTIGGVMSGFALVPIAFGTAHVGLPSWLYVVCIFVGTMGPVVIGVAAQDSKPSDPGKTK